MMEDGGSEMELCIPIMTTIYIYIYVNIYTYIYTCIIYESYIWLSIYCQWCSSPSTVVSSKPRASKNCFDSPDVGLT